MAATIKLATNIPVEGTIGAVYHSLSDTAKKEGWPAQLKLLGTWDGHGDGAVYVPIALTDHLIAVGLIEIGEFGLVRLKFLLNVPQRFEENISLRYCFRFLGRAG